MNSLVRHYRTQHEQVKQSCTLCGKSFSRTCQLWSHALKHQNIKAFPCNHCGYKTNFKNKIAKHLKLRHQDLYDDAIHGYHDQNREDVLRSVQ
jgi:DNA-directed RNA polymerase subunit RPC12/RpoP